MPDLGDAKNLELFLNWDGTSKHAHLIKMRKVKLSDSQIPASKKNKHQPPAKEGSKPSDEGVDMKEGEEDAEEERIGEEEEDEQGLEEEDNSAEEDDRTDSMDVDMKADP